MATCTTCFERVTNTSRSISLLVEKTKTQGLVRLVYEQNGPIRILDDQDKLKNQWISWKAGIDLDTLLIKGLREKGPSEIERLGGEFDRLLLDSIGNQTLALEFLRQLTICSRSNPRGGNLMVLVEAADLLIPAGNGDVASSEGPTIAPDQHLSGLVRRPGLHERRRFGDV